MQEKKREALDALDVDDDGHVSFQEFRAWWEGDDIRY
jgi:Ca2+-binding EF-hand superfamily protein